MRNGKLEMRNKKGESGKGKLELEWHWIGPREMGNGIQMRILVTEELPSEGEPSKTSSSSSLVLRHGLQEGPKFSG